MRSLSSSVKVSDKLRQLLLKGLSECHMDAYEENPATDNERNGKRLMGADIWMIYRTQKSCDKQMESGEKL